MKNWMSLGVLIAGVALVGCTTDKNHLLPAGKNTMLELWHGQDEDQSVSMNDQLQHFPERPLSDNQQKPRAVDTVANNTVRHAQIARQFTRLPNPDMFIYIYPHLVHGNTPVPGYSTVFPLYSQVQYAMPGERTETY
ncbi:TIGR03751 family conjugal transfer lipoprotein [Rouxiella badensis]|uniref:TIGR03751 family conjugal transfer lipoprotein n=1 Tax=Rouxiella badensis TaxID=1646377 RepID=UPI001D15CE78|nr:TIGR03751 family conjugal transfer lipoprotein [Rouxiella badensis]MCC3701667.1 TIGR03751 family conjugal transfer lipoprotein [Rouxiella badensis]